MTTAPASTLRGVAHEPRRHRGQERITLRAFGLPALATTPGWWWTTRGTPRRTTPPASRSASRGAQRTPRHRSHPQRVPPSGLILVTGELYQHAAEPAVGRLVLVLAVPERGEAERLDRRGRLDQLHVAAPASRLGASGAQRPRRCWPPRRAPLPARTPPHRSTRHPGFQCPLDDGAPGAGAGQRRARYPRSSTSSRCHPGLDGRDAACTKPSSTGHGGADLRIRGRRVR